MSWIGRSAPGRECPTKKGKRVSKFMGRRIRCWIWNESVVYDKPKGRGFLVFSFLRQRQDWRGSTVQRLGIYIHQISG